MTGRKIAIKKLKVGQFTGSPGSKLEWMFHLLIKALLADGLDMSAIREVKFLQELRHPNIIEVTRLSRTQPRRRVDECSLF